MARSWTIRAMAGRGDATTNHRRIGRAYRVLHFAFFPAVADLELDARVHAVDTLAGELHGGY